MITGEMWRQYANSMNDTLFIYRKDREVKVLDYLEACDRNDDLIDDGWEHTASLNPQGFLEWLLQAPFEEQVKELANIGISDTP